MLRSKLALDGPLGFETLIVQITWLSLLRQLRTMTMNLDLNPQVHHVLAELVHDCGLRYRCYRAVTVQLFR